ncbi:MAG: helix-turn-helix domain-containing protein [Saprospiraceae bacterium]|nr:helix-turn-helix domain-containing protein [Saprospiraceae bacterium]
MSLAHNIRKFRKQKGWSQDDFAAKLGITRSNVSSYELRGVQPKITLLSDMAKALDIRLDDLVGSDQTDDLPGGNASAEGQSDHGQSNGTRQEVVLREKNKHLKEKVNRLQEIIELKDELLSVKKLEIAQLKSMQIQAVKTNEAAIQFSQHDEQGQFINWRSIEISSDYYEEISPGVLDRILKDPDHLLFEWEDVCIPYFDQLDFDQDRIILNRSRKGSFFPRHYHVEEETLYCVRGSFSENLSKRIVTPGEHISFDPFEHHELTFLEDTLIIISLKYRSRSDK